MKRKRRAWLILRLILSAALLAWLLHDRTLRTQLMALPTPASGGWLLGAWLAAGLGELASLLRFWCCLHLAGMPLPFARAAALHFAGLFASLFLPGMAGGDALKIIFLKWQFPQRRFGGVRAVLMDRLSGFVVISVWTGFVAWMRSDWFAQSPFAAAALRTVLVTVGPMAAALILWFLVSRTHLLRTRIRRFPFRERILECEDGFDAFVGDRLRAVAALVASVVGFAAYFMIFQCTARAYRIPLVWQDTFSVMPLVDLITLLPVTIAGLGLREQAFQWILAPLCGIAPAQGVVVSLAGFFVGSTWALLGASAFVLLRRTLPPALGHA